MTAAGVQDADQSNGLGNKSLAMLEDMKDLYARSVENQ